MKKLVGILNSSIRDKNVHVMSGQLVFREDENYFILEDVREELLASFDDYDRFSELSSIKEDFIYIPVKAEIANSTSFRNLNNYQVFSSNVNVNYAFILDDFVFAGDRCYIKEMLDLFFENPSESDLIFLVSMLYRMGYYDEALEIASIPSLVCIFSGLLPLYRFIHGEQYSFSYMADRFCYFICGIWFLYSDIKINGKKEQ